MSKVLPLGEAIRRHVPDGASVLLGAALECLIPFAAAHELIRQARRDLTLVGPISDVAFDQLVAAGAVRRIVAAWVGNVQHGSGYAFRRAVEQGIPRPLEVEDHSNLSLALSLEAAALGVPYLPTRSLLGTDVLARNGRLRVAPCPFTSVPLVLVPALAPDVAILHVQRADADGSCHVWGPTGVSAAAARASRAVVVIAEEIVAPEVIRSDPNRTLVPGFLVAAVVHLPWGAHPSPVQGHYNRDHALYADWHAHSATAAGAVRWLDDWVRGVPDHAAYLGRLGPARLDGLRRRVSRLAAPVDYGC
ncbi:MAG TPA: CoA-transferase [Methylomirabilota bacterium]|jgi:glutaconate CoA-transferase subunit A|nr:CoA-transferase [Methylomirabilota bacterium]